MNKILIVGHPQSGYEEVETLLNACGMATAQPSRREGFLPGEISTTLCKVHNAAALQEAESPDDIRQIEAGPVWHGMALDLMLGNLDQPIWGWSDPQAIHLLNYWRDLDPDLTFILVYDKPHSVLTRSNTEQAASLTPAALAQRTRNWAAYNAALLHFFHRNPQRCLLVHTQQVRESASSYLQQVRTRIDAPWPEQMVQLASKSQGDSNEPALQNSNTTETTPWSHSPVPIGATATPEQPLPATLVTSLDSTQTTGGLRQTPEEALMDFLADALVQQHPASVQLYDELQAVANLPFAMEAPAGSAPLNAWLGMAAQQQKLQEQAKLAERQLDHIEDLSQRLQVTETLAQQKQQLIERLHQAQTQAETLAQARHQLLEEQGLLHQMQTQAGQQRESALVHDLQQAQLAQQANQQQTSWLQMQLHQVQEALEQQYKESEHRAQELHRLQHSENLAGELAQKIMQLEQQLLTQSRLAADENSHLQAALRQAEHTAQSSQQQIERQAMEHEVKTASIAQRVTELEAARSALEEARRQGQHDNAFLLERLHQAQEALEQQHRESVNRAQDAAQHDQALQAALAEAEQLKNALAEQSTAAAPPNPIAEQENQKLLLQLHQAQEELERAFLSGHGSAYQPAAATSPAAPATPQMHYGAAQRVQNQLSYKLGAVMLERSKSVGGWVSLPWALWRTSRQHQKQAGADEKKLPPIEQYRDAHEAERYRNHLSYRLGNALLNNAKTPVGWVRLPGALRTELRASKKKPSDQ